MYPSPTMTEIEAPGHRVPNQKEPHARDTSTPYFGSEAEIYDAEPLAFLNDFCSLILALAIFTIEINKTPLPGNGQQTADSPPSDATRIRFYLSALLSVINMMPCARIQQWCAEYLKFAYPWTAPQDCGRVWMYLFRWLDVALMHMSTYLFLWAVWGSFYTTHHYSDVQVVAYYTLVASAVVHVLFSISPLIFSDSLCDNHYSMEWPFTKNVLSDDDMDKFMETLPGYISSSHTKKGRLDQYLTADHILSRIMEHLMACVSLVEISGEASIARVSSCIKTLWLIFQYSRECKEKSSMSDKLKEELQLQRTYFQRLMNDFQALCGVNNPMIALRASSIRALALETLLSQLVPPDSRTTDVTRFPSSLIPIYKFFFPNDNTDTIRQLDDGHMPGSMKILRMWKTLLHDGPLANLTTLAQVIRDKESPSSLSFCWKTLDVLLEQPWTMHSGESARAQSDFDDLHENIRTCARAGELGVRLKPLLDKLDRFARGRRLLMVFSGHPKYHNRADVIFGKEFLRSGDLVEAFAYCLPDFISNNSPEVCKDFMEKVVRHDDLWASLQVNLEHTQRSNSPTPEKLRVFEGCCSVLDLALSVLEDSQEVDWRASELGSLLQRFQSFITHCFPGALMGRTASFRARIIQVRLYKAILFQIRNDFEGNGVLLFRSQWDIAILSRLICFLGLRDNEDSEFWNSCVDGGNTVIGREFGTFNARAHKMIGVATRDGPLLFFCILGHLVVTAIPLNQSRIEVKDIVKVLGLQRGIIRRAHLPLSSTSNTAWERLVQLRGHMDHLRDQNTGRDREILQSLLWMIDDVFNLRFSGS